MKLAAIAALSLMVGPSLNAQATKEASTNTANPIVTTVRQMEARYAKNLSGAADEMPADKYSYRPTPEQITFGHLMMHVAEANNSLCAFAAGEQPRETKAKRDRPKGRLDQGGERLFRVLRAGPGKSGRQQPWASRSPRRKDRPDAWDRRCCAWSRTGQTTTPRLPGTCD